MLDKKPLARYPRAKRGLKLAGGNPAKLNLAAAVNRTYLRGLARNQRAFRARLAKVVKGFRVERSYRLTLNGLAVQMTATQAAKVRRMKGVRAVTPDVPYRPTCTRRRADRRAHAVGAGRRAGQRRRGIKVAVIDSGIFVRRTRPGTTPATRASTTRATRCRRATRRATRASRTTRCIVARRTSGPSDPPTTGNDTPIQGPGAQPARHARQPARSRATRTRSSASGSRDDQRRRAEAYLMNYRVFYPSELAGGLPERQRLDRRARQGDRGRGQRRRRRSQQLLGLELPEHARVARPDGPGCRGGRRRRRRRRLRDRATRPATGHGQPALRVRQGDLRSARSPRTQPSSPRASTSRLRRRCRPALTNVDASAALRADAERSRDDRPRRLCAGGDAASRSPGDAKTFGCSLAGDVSPFPAGSLTGKIALIERGACLRLQLQREGLQRAARGAIGTIIYNNEANGETIGAMGAGVHAADVTIPSVLVRRSNGLAIVAHHTANPSTAQISFLYNVHSGTSVGDVMASFSSRGPTQDKSIKPDVVAPGRTCSPPGTQRVRSRPRSSASGPFRARAWRPRTSPEPQRCFSSSIRGGRRRR